MNFLIIIIGSALNAFTVMTTWGWFVTPLGVQAIGFWHSVGLTTFVQVTLGSRALYADTFAQENQGSRGAMIVVANIVFPVMCLTIAFIAKLGMGA